MIEIPENERSYPYRHYLVVDWTPEFTPDFKNIKEFLYKGEVYLYVDHMGMFNFFPPETYAVTLLKKDRETFVIEHTPDTFEYSPSFENNKIKLGDLIINKDLHPESTVPSISEEVIYKGKNYHVVNVTIIRRINNTPRIDFLLRPL